MCLCVCVNLAGDAEGLQTAIVSCRDAHHLLREFAVNDERFDIVDVDSFGSNGCIISLAIEATTEGVSLSNKYCILRSKAFIVFRKDGVELLAICLALTSAMSEVHSSILAPCSKLPGFGISHVDRWKCDGGPHARASIQSIRKSFTALSLAQ